MSCGKIGDTAEDNDENWVKTRFAKEKNIFTISGAVGNTDVIPVNRTWKLWFYGVKESNFKIYVGDGNVTVYLNGKRILTDLRLL